jgi:hypothetical protein
MIKSSKATPLQNACPGHFLVPAAFLTSCFNWFLKIYSVVCPTLALLLLCTPA